MQAFVTIVVKQKKTTHIAENSGKYFLIIV